MFEDWTAYVLGRETQGWDAEQRMALVSGLGLLSGLWPPALPATLLLTSATLAVANQFT